MRTPEENRAYAKAYYQKMKNDPTFIKKERARTAAWAKRNRQRINEFQQERRERVKSQRPPKYCAVCNINISDLHPNCKRCKPCSDQHKLDAANNRSRKLREERPEYIRAIAEKSRKKRHKENPEMHMWHSAKSRAKRLRIPFDITKEDIIIPEFCPVFGIKLTIGVRSENGAPHPYSASLDKIIPELGYVKGNIRVISFRANELKRDGTLEEMEAIVAYMKREAA